jgi:hypothetical protein
LAEIKGKYKSLKTHGTASAAAKAYDDEAIKLRRPLSKLNYPQHAPIGYTPIQQSLYASNSVGYRGVSKNRKNFQAQIKIDATLTYIGTYTTSKDAAIAYDRAVIKNRFPSSCLNFVHTEYSHENDEEEVDEEALSTEIDNQEESSDEPSSNEE